MKKSQKFIIYSLLLQKLYAITKLYSNTIIILFLYLTHIFEALNQLNAQLTLS